MTHGQKKHKKNLYMLHKTAVPKDISRLQAQFSFLQFSDQ
jgi:hypothetical protein